MKTIESKQNPHIKTLVKLRERKHRDALGRYTIEGLRETQRALASATTHVHQVYICPALFSSPEHAGVTTQAQARGAAVYAVAKNAFAHACYRDGPDGILAVAAQRMAVLESHKCSPNPLILVVDSIEKPGNLGALLRSADSAGAEAVICCNLKLDLFNPNVIRASQGAFFTMPTYLASPTATLDFLNTHGLHILTTTPGAETVYWDANLQHPTALVMGSEHTGLSDSWLNAAHTCIKIPQYGVSDSLNVAAAATLVLYEALRQRRAGL